MLTQAFRDAVRQGGDAELQSALRSLIARLPLELSFKVACEQLSAFLPTFEAGASNVAWIRRFLEGAETSFGGTEAVTQPVAFELEEDRYRNVGADPEFIFAWSKGHALEKNPEPAPLRNTIIQVSLDGGKSWKHPATPDSFSAKEHKYTYELMGDGKALQVRINDKPVADNFGRVQIFLLPGA